MSECCYHIGGTEWLKLCYRLSDGTESAWEGYTNVIHDVAISNSICILKSQWIALRHIPDQNVITMLDSHNAQSDYGNNGISELELMPCKYLRLVGRTSLVGFDQNCK